MLVTNGCKTVTKGYNGYKSYKRLQPVFIVILLIFNRFKKLQKLQPFLAGKFFKKKFSHLVFGQKKSALRRMYDVTF